MTARFSRSSTAARMHIWTCHLRLKSHGMEDREAVCTVSWYAVWQVRGLHIHGGFKGMEHWNHDLFAVFPCNVEYIDAKPSLDLRLDSAQEKEVAHTSP